MADAHGHEALKVFISYSRRDSGDFAEEIAAGLQLGGFAPLLDRHDIVAGEDWEARLNGLIAQADTVVFVVSPEAMKSRRCKWEAEQAAAQSKRLLPVIFKSVAEQCHCRKIPAPLRGRSVIATVPAGDCPSPPPSGGPTEGGSRQDVAQAPVPATDEAEPDQQPIGRTSANNVGDLGQLIRVRVTPVSGLRPGPGQRPARGDRQAEQSAKPRRGIDG